MFLLGQILAVLGTLIFFSFTWGQISQEAIENRKWKFETDKTIKRMDEEGTNASKYALKAHVTKLDELDFRLKSVEGDGRKIDVMAEKISRIDDSVKEIRDRAQKR